MAGIIGPHKDGTADKEILKQLADRPPRQTVTPDFGLPSNITNTTTEPLPSNLTEADEGISSGGVAGIVIGVLVALVALSALLFLLYKRRLLPWMSRKPDTVIFSFDTSFQNLIDCPNNSLRGSERRSHVSSRASNPTSYASSAPSLTSDVPTRASYASASRRPTTPSSTYSRCSTPTNPSNPYPPEADSGYTHQQTRPSYQSTPQYLQNPYYFPQSRMNYKQYNPSYVPSNVYSAPRGYSANNFYYRPSRHIDRQLMVYYNWAINEELAEPVRPRVHQPRIIGESRY